MVRPQPGRYWCPGNARVCVGPGDPGGPPMTVIAAVNLKGGVGKTSCCLHLGGALAQLGRRVLLADNDPQSSLTAGFLGVHAARALDPAGTIAAVHAGDDPFPEALI